MQKDEREEAKRSFAEIKKDAIVALKDKKRWLVFLVELLLVGVCLAIDLLTKEFVYGHCKNVADIVVIDKVLRFTAVENTGASFGIFGESTTALTVVSLICSLILIVFLFISGKRRNGWLRASLILLTAGALGNVIDRLAFHYVRDWVYFELIDFAVFNLADSCLTVGTVLLIIYLLFFYSKDEEKIRAEYLKTHAADSASVEPSGSASVAPSGSDGNEGENVDKTEKEVPETEVKEPENEVKEDTEEGKADGE